MTASLRGPMPRLREQERRPDRFAINQGLARCYHRGCTYTSGPDLTRAYAVAIAQDHYVRVYRRST